MDQLLPRKPQDVDRWSDQAERDPLEDAATGPGDRWTNESARPDPDYPAPAPGDGGTGDVNGSLEDDGTYEGRGTDPTIHGYER